MRGVGWHLTLNPPGQAWQAGVPSKRCKGIYGVTLSQDQTKHTHRAKALKRVNFP